MSQPVESAHELVASCPVFLVATAGAAHAESRVEITADPTFASIAPGALADVQVTLRNVGDTASQGAPIHLGAAPGYGVEQVAPSPCGPVVSDPDNGAISIDVPPLAPRETLVCTLEISRDAATIDSARFELSVDDDSYSTTLLFVGTFTDVAVSNERISYDVDAQGVVQAVFRLTAANLGTRALEPFDVSSCGGDGATIDNAIDGGCAATTSACARGQIPYPAQGARLPALAPGAQASCLLRVSGPIGAIAPPVLTIDEDASWDIYLTASGNGAHLFDNVTGNNSTTLLLPAGGTPAPAVAAPTLQDGSLALLVLALLATAMAGLRRRRSTLG